MVIYEYITKIMYTPCELSNMAADVIDDTKDVDIEGSLIIVFLFLGIISPIWYPIYAGGCLIKHSVSKVHKQNPCAKSVQNKLS